MILHFSVITFEHMYFKILCVNLNTIIQLFTLLTSIMGESTWNTYMIWYTNFFFPTVLFQVWNFLVFSMGAIFYCPGTSQFGWRETSGQDLGRLIKRASKSEYPKVSYSTLFLSLHIRT